MHQPIDVWNKLQPTHKQAKCPLCHGPGRPFLKYKRGTEVVTLQLVCFNHMPLHKYFEAVVEHPLVPAMIAASKTFPPETINLVILELGEGVVAVA